MDGDFTCEDRPHVRITPSDVGKRVSIRQIIQMVDDRPVLSDTVGNLTSWDDGTLTITRRNGDSVRIPQVRVVAAKTVPPPPPRRRRVADITVPELQRIAASGWPARESEPLGEWTLRAAGGFTRRANSVLAHGDPGAPLREALERVLSWYAARGLPAYLQVTDDASGASPGPGGALSAVLDAEGWAVEAPTQTRTAALLPLADAPAIVRVRLAREPGPGWLARYRRTGGVGDAAYQVLRGGPSVWFASVPAEDEEAGADTGAATSTGEDPGVPAAIGRCVVDGRWAGFSAVEVDPGHRRRGLGTAVMAALATRAAAEGADSAYLQVEEDNEAACALYDRLGFTTHHRYRYRRAPNAQAG